jgi:hypothetical protein
VEPVWVRACRSPTPRTLHEIKSRAIDLNRINRRPATEPFAPTSGISGAPLPKRGSFLNHRRISFCSSSALMTPRTRSSIKLGS